MADPIDILIVDEVNYLQEMLKPMLLHEPRLQIIGECKDVSEALRMTEEYRPHMMVMNFDMPSFNAIKSVKKLLAIDASLLIVMVFSQGSKHFIKEALEAGVKEYIMKPFRAQDMIDTLINLHGFHESLEEVTQLQQEEIKEKKEGEVESKVITIFGIKGGVGKSTIAVNLAVGLARNTANRVVIVDLDLQAGDVSLMMNLFPKRTIADLSKDLHILDEEIIEEYMDVHSSGVRVLSAPISPELSEYITALYIEKIIKVLSKIYHYIIIDTAPSFNDINLTALDMSQRVILVTTLDLTSMKNTKASIQIMDKLNYPKEKVHLVLNRYQRDLGISIRNMEKTTGKKLLATIPEDYETANQAVNRGEPFILKRSKISVVKSLQNLVDFFI